MRRILRTPTLPAASASPIPPRTSLGQGSRNRRRPSLALSTVLVLIGVLLFGAERAEAAIANSQLLNPVSGKCLDVTGNTSTDGTQVEIWTCNGGANQQWTSTSANELRVTIGGVTKCLDASGQGTSDGTKVVIWTCNGGANQKWNLGADQTIAGAQSGRCLDADAGGTADGTIVQLWTCKTPGDNNQRWIPPSTSTSLTINGTGDGRVFDGVGAISGGGGNSRLLIDYPEPQRSQILDYLFKPDYGANVQLLKLEIGGDANSTDGAEPSIEHTRGTVNCNVGYEFWLGEQAKARNPDIKLYGLAWAGPGWIGGGNWWSQDAIDYLTSWLDCAKSHGLTVDYLGGRNEKGHDKTWYENLHRALADRGYGNVKVVGDDTGWSVADDMAADPAFNAAVDIVGVHYPCGYLSDSTTCDSTANALATGKQLWASENGSLDIDGGAAALIRSITRGYIDGRMTAYLNWPVVAALTPNLPYATVGLAVAPSPWSGSYRLGKETWAMAQVTQFVKPGWRFIDSASGYLGGARTNGSYITLKNGTDYSTIIETAGASTAHTLNVTVTGGLSTGTVHVWATNLNSGDYFIRQPDLAPSGGGYQLTLQPGYIYSLTTTTGQAKGTAAGPAQHGLALPYRDGFDTYGTGSEAKYVSDMQGAFEARACLNGRSGNCLQQVAPVKPIEWQGDSDAYALVGDTAWANYTASVDVDLQQAGTVKLIGRAGAQSRPQDRQAGYEFRINDGGSWTLGKRDTGGTLTTLASGTTTAPGLGRWHTLALSMQGSTIAAKLDGATLGTVTDGTYTSGQVGFGVAGYQTDQFDNLSIS
ncbi:ricin-type beta-trefoil lectin domain protein [Actinoallomurus sp. NPDC050550]|uniref:ricin-type beta-trefoil lectin domain protein n=1 Tax=Actinoallomurus sp. NPDC050550 TaxID=3154937 RepID=UPI0033D2A08F